MGDSFDLSFQQPVVLTCWAKFHRRIGVLWRAGNFVQEALVQDSGARLCCYGCGKALLTFPARSSHGTPTMGISFGPLLPYQETPHCLACSWRVPIGYTQPEPKMCPSWGPRVRNLGRDCVGWLWIRIYFPLIKFLTVLSPTWRSANFILPPLIALLYWACPLWKGLWVATSLGPL